MSPLWGSRDNNLSFHFRPEHGEHNLHDFRLSELEHHSEQRVLDMESGRHARQKSQTSLSQPVHVSNTCIYSYRYVFSTLYCTEYH